ncbi:uncharacterized protein LOC111286148 [Durio zibethinus]|uniref:Uncharacterized protein LOC111286148 n=1 Tax=Durio zibethinus TaxID=66656 RepID=A0A6P5XU21_DURZI|nr:uncharacterized protein LOC111286148 [Durio zibethinus]
MASVPPLPMEEQPPTTEERPSSEKKQEQEHDYFLSHFDEDTDEEESSESGTCEGEEFREMTDAEQKAFLAAFKESGGFDVPSFPEVYYNDLITPMNMSKGGPEYLFRYSVAGIGQYNEEHGTNYEVVRVEKCMQQAARGIKYYITFLAKNKIASEHGSDTPKAADDGSDKTEIFEALVLFGIPKDKEDEPIDVIFCRLKGTRPDL